MDQHFGSCLPKFFSRDKNGIPKGEKETRGVGKEIFRYLSLQKKHFLRALFYWAEDFYIKCFHFLPFFYKLKYLYFLVNH
jgi:hypothetical protein